MIEPSNKSCGPTLGERLVRSSTLPKLIGIVVRLFAAIVTPFVIVSLYLLFTGFLFHGRPVSAYATDVAFAVSIMVGCLFLLTIPLPLFFRLCCLPIYAVVIWVMLVPYTLLFIGVVFHAIIP
jgi:hypothetical protein